MKTTKQRATASLRAKINDRPRAVLILCDEIYLSDDSGAENIASFNDELACHYFLKWLKAERIRLAASRKAWAAGAPARHADTASRLAADKVAIDAQIKSWQVGMVHHLGHCAQVASQ